jgi:hypothetical protein
VPITCFVSTLSHPIVEDANQPGISHGCGLVGSSQGVSGHNSSSLNLEVASTSFGISSQLLENATKLCRKDVLKKHLPGFKLLSHLQYRFAIGAASLCPYQDWKGPHVNEFFNFHFNQWFSLLKKSAKGVF